MNIKDCTIIDVRTREEFMGGHVAGSKNIPLLEILAHEEEFKNAKKPIIFCCVSGARSGQAAEYFKQKGIDCENGGSWLNINFKVNQ